MLLRYPSPASTRLALVRLTFLLAAVLAASALPHAGAAETQKAVTVKDGWVTAPATGETTAAAFAVIDNPGMYDLYIVSAVADVAGRVQIRDASKPGDAKAQTVEFIVVPAYDSVTMKPEAMHLVLMDLKKPLKPGDPVALTLTTDGGTELAVTAVVK